MVCAPSELLNARLPTVSKVRYTEPFIKRIRDLAGDYTLIESVRSAQGRARRIQLSKQGIARRLASEADLPMIETHNRRACRQTRDSLTISPRIGSSWIGLDVDRMPVSFGPIVC